MRQAPNGSPGTILSICETVLSCCRPQVQLNADADQTIRCFDDFENSIRKLQLVKATEITSNVGVKAGGDLSRWFLLRDSICVRVMRDESSLVSRIIIGESGKGYGGKERWVTQVTTELKAIVLEVDGSVGRIEK